jgi:hypothetical protein
MSSPPHPIQGSALGVRGLALRAATPPNEVMIHESKFDSSENFGCNDFFRVLGCFTFWRGGA